LWARSVLASHTLCLPVRRAVLFAPPGTPLLCDGDEIDEGREGKAPMRILIVDDDPDMVEVTTYALRKQGYQIVAATDGREAVQRWREDRPDLVLLDIGLPRLNGIEVCRAIRESSSTPVIMVTGYGEEERVVQGFQAGADDYVVKPFSLRQLTMRIRAVLNRSHGRLAAEPLGQVETKHLKLDVDSHVVTNGDFATHLTPLEFRILYMLASNEGRVVKNERLIQYAWGYEAAEGSLLKTHVCHIRRKLRMSQKEGPYIKSVPWVGYQLSGQ
jgi:DNA-binding response OmpR family regulator